MLYLRYLTSFEYASASFPGIFYILLGKKVSYGTFEGFELIFYEIRGFLAF